MASLQLSANFWTLRDDVIIPDCDLGAFKYYNKDGEALSGPYGNLKKSLCQSRDKVFTPNNKRPSRLKDTLIELEEILAHHALVYLDWSVGDSKGKGLLVFSNGFLVHITSDLHTCDVSEIIIDKTLEGKLLADIVSVTTASQLLVLAHGIPQLTVIQTGQPLFGMHKNNVTIPMLSQCNVTVGEIQLPGPGTRRQERKITLSPNSSHICVWWEREGSELFAWAPIVKAEDRANILIYPSSTVGRAELLACHYTEHNPFSVLFSVKDPSQLRVTELLSTARGRLSVNYSIFSIQQPLKLIQQRLLRIPALLRCHSHSPDEQILLLGCVDASIVAWDLTRDSITSYKASFIPFHLSWHPSSSFFVVAGERGQLQCWDRALNPLLLRTAPVREQQQASVLHLQQYLRHQPSLVSLKWAIQGQENDEEISPSTAGPGRLIPIGKLGRHQQRQKSMRSNRKKSRSPGRSTRIDVSTEQSRAPSQQLLICFERGPIICLQFLTSCWPVGPSSFPAINSLSLCSEFLVWRQLDAAVRHLLSLKWTNIATFQEEDVLLGCLLKVVNGLLQDSSPNADDLLQKLITNVLDRVPSGDDELADPILDAARRSCRAMLRKGRLHSAAVYALRVQDPDLLVELVLHARKAGDEALVAQATTILDVVRDGLTTSGSSSSDRSSSRASSYISGSYTSSSSDSSCSTCGEDEDHHLVDDAIPLSAVVVQQNSQPVQRNNNVLPPLSNLRLEENADQVHVISFGVV